MRLFLKSLYVWKCLYSTLALDSYFSCVQNSKLKIICSIQVLLDGQMERGPVQVRMQKNYFLERQLQQLPSFVTSSSLSFLDNESLGNSMTALSVLNNGEVVSSSYRLSTDTQPCLTLTLLCIVFESRASRSGAQPPPALSCSPSRMQPRLWLALPTFICHHSHSSFSSPPSSFRSKVPRLIFTAVDS